MTEVKPAGEAAVAETKPKNDHILETHPEVKAEPAKADPPTKTEADPDEVDTDKDTDTGEGKKKRGGWQRKIDKLEAEIAALKAPIGTKPADAPAKPDAAIDAEPKPEDFPTWGEYTKALVKHEAKQEAKAAKEENAKEQAKAEAQKASMTKVEKYKSQVTESRTFHKDFDEALNEYEGPSSPELHSAILDSDQGAEVAYYLAKNPEEAEKMRGMNTGDLYRFIGKIEAKLEAGKVKETPAVKTSKAPPPVQPVGKGSGSDDEPPDDPDEYIAWRRKRRANR